MLPDREPSPMGGVEESRTFGPENAADAARGAPILAYPS
jgi:hypothetical protein